MPDFFQNTNYFCLKWTHICYNHFSGRLQGVKVLIVDDDKQTTSMLSKFFNYEGHSTVVSNDPMEGLTRIKKEKYDVILLDIKMPVLSGLKIIQILAAGGNLKNKNIFLFSGAYYLENQIKDMLRRDGVNGFLKKPIDLDELLTTITCWGFYLTPSRIQQFELFFGKDEN